MHLQDIDYIIDAHSNHARKEGKAYRKWDGRTPYHIHPLWCASMIATETSLAEKIRQDGVLVLLYHDILEDTALPLPDWLSGRVRQMVGEMTFQRGASQEMKEVWSRPSAIRLYKFYDKVSNLLDGCWMSDEKKKAYIEYTQALSEDVEQNYGLLNITLLARAMLR